MKKTTDNIKNNSNLLTEKELMAWLECTQRAALERYLRRNGIPVIYGNGGKICTTLQAINEALHCNNNSTTAVEF
jgi:hypothetical protein